MNDALLTMMNRHGYEEECFFGFKWYPWFRDGEMIGVYASCTDTTTNVILDRRTTFVKELRSTVAPVNEWKTLWETLRQKFDSASIDLPTVMIYSKLGRGTSPSQSSNFHLEVATGVATESEAAPNRIWYEGSSRAYAPAMRAAVESKTIVVLRKANGDLPEHFYQRLEPRSFGARSVELAICPIFSGGDVVCFLIAGLSPRKRYDKSYESLLMRLTNEIVSPKVDSLLLAHERARGRQLAQKAEEERNARLLELEKSEARYRQFAEHAPLGVARFTKEGQFEYANPAWTSIFGSDSKDGSQTSWATKTDPQHPGLLVKIFEDMTVTREPITVEYKLTEGRDGTYAFDQRVGSHPTWLLMTAYEENDEHIVCWATDISAQKAAAITLNEKMEEAILQKSRQENFIDMISHEIRNPMSAVLHCTEDITRTAHQLLDRMTTTATPEQELDSTQFLIDNCLESARTILYCIDHQKRIIDDVLTLSKLDAALLEIALVPIEPRHIVRKALRIFDRELKESAIDLQLVEDPSLADLDISGLLIDPNRFMQVVINLITNSIKFTRTSQQKQIRVEVSASLERPTPWGVHFFQSDKEYANELHTSIDPTSRVFLSVSVSDTGKGISEDERQRLFNKFAQASPKTHIEYGGSGLGLYISRQITELLGGQIGVAREQEVGATFVFFIQAQRVMVGTQDQQDHLATATKQLRLHVTHNPVTPVVSPPTTGRNSPRFRPEPPSRTPTTRLQPDAAERSEVTPISTSSSWSSLTTAAKPHLKRPYKILVVEDNLINQKVLCKQLQNRGYNVHAANDGREALGILQKAARDGAYFTVVVCDLEMPVMNGIDCAKEIRRLEQNEQLPGHIPIIAATANARTTHVEQAMEAGMDSYALKPYKMDELVLQIEKYAVMTFDEQ